MGQKLCNKRVFQKCVEQKIKKQLQQQSFRCVKQNEKLQRKLAAQRFLKVSCFLPNFWWEDVVTFPSTVFVTHIFIFQNSFFLITDIYHS